MHKPIILALAGGAAFAAMQPAAAADLGAGGYKDNEYAVAPTYWQGPYAGVLIGAGAASACIEDASRDTPCVSGSSIAGGVLAGYNFRHGSWVGGFEGDITAMAVDESKYIAGYGDISMNSNWNGTLRVRAGYVAWERILLYATGGLGIAEWEMKSPVSGKKSAAILSPAFGFGAEVALDANWALRGEAMFISSGTAEIDMSGHKQDVGLGASELRVGLTRRF